MDRIEKRNARINQIIEDYLGNGIGPNTMEEQKERTINIANAIEESILAHVEEMCEHVFHACHRS